MEPTARRAVDFQDFTAVILVGHGENLYPLMPVGNDLSNREDPPSKALMPVGNVPIIKFVLDWVLASGLTDVLIIVPALDPITEYVQLTYSSSTTSREPRIILKAYDDGEEEEDDDQDFGVDGTARLLRRFRSYIKTDFVLLPCDISFPSKFTLASILDKHRATPDAVLTSVFYEPVESVAESEEKTLVGLDKETGELLLIRGLETLEDEFHVRMSLIEQHPTLSLSTRLLDSHVYVFRRTVLDLLATRKSRDLTSVREQFVPWLLKGQWQEGLAERWSPILCPPKRDPFAEALARSTTAKRNDQINDPDSPRSVASENTPLPLATPAMSDGEQLLEFKSSIKPKHHRKHRAEWTCRVIVVKPEVIPPPATGKGKKTQPEEPEYVVRANSLAGYWEINRRVVRTMGGKVSEAAEISSTAQISPDCIVGDGAKIADRASIKKCVVGRHCVIGKGAKLTGCVLWDWVTVEDNARIENTVLCSNVRVGEKAQIKDCEFGAGFRVPEGAVIKGERLVVGQEV